MYSLDEVRKVDPEIAQAIVDEQERQNSHIELIASENWVSKAVMAAMGSVLTNKYAEGYPGKRYYGGCDYVDEVENLAIERAPFIQLGPDKLPVLPAPSGTGGRIDQKMIHVFSPLLAFVNPNVFFFCSSSYPFKAVL